MRFNSNGTLDTSFSGDGILHMTKASDLLVFNDVAIAPGGKIVAVGYGAQNLVVARYNANGTPDNSFDYNGKLGVNLGAYASYGQSVAVAADGRITVAGTAVDYLPPTVAADLMLARFAPNGQTELLKRYDFSNGDADYGEHVTLLPGGKILVGGSVTPAAGQTALWRFHSDGTPDKTFSGDGLSMGGFGEIVDFAVQNTGKIITLEGGMTLRRYNSNGTIDHTFLQSSYGYTYPNPGGLALSGSDKVVAAGYFAPSSKTWDGAVMRLNAGSIPVAPNGLVATPISKSAISLSWNDNSINEQSFEIERSSNSAFTVVYDKTVISNIKWVTFDGLPPNAGWYFRVRAKNSVGDSAWSNVVFAKPQQTTFSTLRIDAGASAQYVNGQGKTFSADQYFVAGQAVNDNFAVGQTTDDTLYTSYRTDYNFMYNLPVVNGLYTVKLHFVDPTSTAMGQRKFDVWAEDQKIESNLDIFAAAGARNAFAPLFAVNVTDGFLSLNFVAHAGKAIISAIEIWPQ
jgi:uncharacterized delta-60 repeat protein